MPSGVRYAAVAAADDDDDDYEHKIMTIVEKKGKMLW